MRSFPVFDTYMSYAETGQVLIMDEGTNSLDAETEQQILMNLIKRKITITAVSHDKKVINNFKICYKIDNKDISLIKNQ